MKIARILDEGGGTFGLEYDNTLGKRNTMRLDALNYDQALREAKSFLGINAEGRARQRRNNTFARPTCCGRRYKGTPVFARRSEC